MKKLFAVLAISGALVACNNNSESTTTADSTSVTTVDSSAISTPVVTDSAANSTIDSTNTPK